MQTFQAELRADGLHVNGYVNVPGRRSHPVVTPRGRVIEVIEQRAFQDAIDRAENINLMLDHERVIGSTKENTLKLYEDDIGLRAETVITDEETIAGAKAGKLKGWSFGMKNVEDSMEERANDLPIRHVKKFDMFEVTLAMRKRPVYSATSVEVRAEGEEEIEQRATEGEFSVVDMVETPKKLIDYSEFENRINNLKSAK